MAITLSLHTNFNNFLFFISPLRLNLAESGSLHASSDLETGSPYYGCLL